jgi:hypothetical protein
VKGIVFVVFVVAMLVLAVAASLAAEQPPLTDVSLIIGRAPVDQATPATIPAGTVLVLGDGDEGISKVTAE